jgi:hypothetical protein
MALVTYIDLLDKVTKQLAGAQPNDGMMTGYVDDVRHGYISSEAASIRPRTYLFSRKNNGAQLWEMTSYMPKRDRK